MGEQVKIDPNRQLQLKKMIAKLHGGSAAEVVAMEQSLIEGGMPVEEVQRLCEVHVQVFEHSLSKGGRPKEIAGHPVHTMIEENRLARKKAAALRAAARAWANKPVRGAAPADAAPRRIHGADAKFRTKKA